MGVHEKTCFVLGNRNQKQEAMFMQTHKLLPEVPKAQGEAGVTLRSVFKLRFYFTKSKYLIFGNPFSRFFGVFKFWKPIYTKTHLFANK